MKVNKVMSLQHETIFNDSDVYDLRRLSSINIQRDNYVISKSYKPKPEKERKYILQN